MSADDQRARRAADDGLRVVDHLGHRDPHGRLVAEDDLAERIADEDHRDAGLVEDAARSGSRRRSASRSACRRRTAARCRRRSGGGRCRWWRSCWLPLGLGRADSLRGGVARVQRDRDPVEQPLGDRALRQERQVVARAVGGQDRDPVRVGAEARSPASATSLATSRSTPLRRSFSRGALERAGLGREADEDRARVGAARGSGRRRCRARGRSARSRRAGPASARAGASSASARGQLGLGGLDRPEVGDRRGHDQGVEPGRPVVRLGRPAAAPHRGRPSTRPGRRSRRRAAGPRRSRR